MLPCLFRVRPVPSYPVHMANHRLVTWVAGGHRRRGLAGTSRGKGETCRLTPPSSGRPKGRCAPFAPPLMSNVRPRQGTGFATSLQASRFESHRAPAVTRTARSWPSLARGSLHLCSLPPSVSGCARAVGFALLGRGSHGRARVHGAVVTHVPQSCSTAAPIKADGAPPRRQCPRLSS